MNKGSGKRTREQKNKKKQRETKKATYQRKERIEIKRK